MHKRALSLLLALGLAFGVLAVVPAPARAEDSSALQLYHDYVALGDSYAAGVGTREYINDGTNCMRSHFGYPGRVVDEVQPNFNFIGACSGATVPDVLDDQLLFLDPNVDLVTVTVGGNDAGFTDVLRVCSIQESGDCFDAIEDANDLIANGLPTILGGLYSEIAQASTAPDVHVVVVGYPRLFNGTVCAGTALIGPDEQAALNDTADLLVEVTRTVAQEFGFAFVDVRNAFAGHAVCDNQAWINGLSVPVAESFHPNIAGYELGYLPAVMAAL